MKHTKLYDFQYEDVRTIRDFGGRALLASEVGLGKTLTSLYYAWKYLPEEPSGPIVCVVPAHLKINWQREAEKHLGMKAEILSGQTCEINREKPLNPNEVIIINYDILVPPKWSSRAPLPKNSWAHYLISLRPRLVILDEGQMVKTPTSSRTRAARRLCRSTPHVLILTGTPLANKPGDLWSLLNILHPSEFPSETEFLHEYTNAYKSWFGWQFKGARNLHLLHGRLRNLCMIRRRKADVLSQLPPVTISVLPLEVDLTEYRRAENDYLGWLEENRPGASARAAAALDLTKRTGLKELAGKLKLTAVKKWIEDLLEETEGKLLMGAVHHSVARPLARAFGRAAVLVDGDLDSDEKTYAFDAFNTDPKVKLLVGNLQAAGTGWSCRSTSDVAICELPWRPDEVTQFIGRVHGIARGEEGVAAHARLLIAAGTIEEDLCYALEQKASWANMAIDGVEGAGDLDVHQRVRELMRQRRGR